MKNIIFTGAAVAIVTPFHKDGTVNYDKLEELLEEQISSGTDAIVICGTTGESATLSGEEHLDCIKFAINKVNHRIPVIAGTGSNDTAYATEMSIDAEKAGADGLLLVTPYYNKTSQKGMVAHFTHTADAVNIPIILYNVPSRTGCKIDIETYKELSKHPNIVAAKEASGDLSFVARLAAETDLHIYSGNDDQIVPLMSLGGLGVISVLANVAPRQTHEICQTYLDGDVKKSLQLQLEAMELCNALFCEVNPIPVKKALSLMGMGAGTLRMPLSEMEPSNVQRLEKAMKDYGLLS